MNILIKSIFPWLPFVAIIALAPSCASTSKAAAEKDQEAKSFGVDEERGTVYIYRTGRMVGAAGQLQVKVNGKEAGGTGPGTYFKWDLKPGTYTFSSFTTESSAIVELNVKAGELYFLRQDARMGLSSGRVSLQEVSDSKGKSEVADCKLLVSAYVPE
jgi:hypothetical protein